MAEGGGPGVGSELFAKGIGQQSGGGDDVKANEDETPQLVISGMDKSYFTAVKFATAIPLIGGLIEMIFPANPGKVSLFAGLETEGIAGKTIRQGSGGPQGGLLAKIAGELMKNSAIPGGSPHGDGGANSGGGDSGGNSSGSQSFDSYASSSGMSDSFIAAGGGNQFVFTDFNPRDLGTLSSPLIGDMGMGGRGANMGVG